MDAFDGGRGSGAFPLWPALLLRFKDGGERSVCPGALPGPCFRSGAVRQEIVHSFLNGSPGGGFPVTVVLIAHAFCKMHQVSPCLKSVNAVLPGFRPFDFLRLGAVGSDVAVHVGEGFRQPLGRFMAAAQEGCQMGALRHIKQIMVVAARVRMPALPAGSQPCVILVQPRIHLLPFFCR